MSESIGAILILFGAIPLMLWDKRNGAILPLLIVGALFLGIGFAFAYDPG